MHESRGLTAGQWIMWFAVGMVVALAAQWAQIGFSDHDLTFTLRVGSASAAREFIEDELGTVQLTLGVGHDGQYNYLIARDPLANDGTADLAERPGYRFRRPLLGWLSGGLGVASPAATLWGLTAWTAFGLGLATAAMADIAMMIAARLWATLGVVANLGLLLSVQLVTSDSLGLGLALLAVAMALRRRRTLTVLALVLAGLAKEPYLLFALGLSGWLWFQDRKSEAVPVLVVPVLALGFWTAWIGAQTAGAFSSGGNIDWPLAGFAASVGQWSGGADLVQALFAISSVMIAAVAVAMARDRLLSWLTVPWLAVAIMSSRLVWVDGNNAARALSALWALGFLGVALWVARHSDRSHPTSMSRRNLPV